MSAVPPLPGPRAEQRLADARPLLAPGEAVAEAHRCLYCHDAPCVAACPTGIDVPTFIRKISTGNVRGAARVILSANLLGYSCARVCPVEVLCVGACVYNAWHRAPPIAIGRLQRYATEALVRDGGAAALLPRAPATGRRVACVGAGPASLACAGYLALEGVEVTVYEQRALPGGLNTTGVAPYKMHAESALEEVAFVRSLGVEIKTGVTVGSDVPFERLLAEHDAVFLGAGLGADARLGIEGEDAPGVTGAVAWIERMKLHPGAAPDGVRAAVVIGGGNTAIDAARELARLGVPSVTMLYRRTAAEMSGYAHELEQARRDGVTLVERAVPARFERGADGRLAAVTLADGRAFPCTLAVVAIGQASLAAMVRAVPGVETDARGRVVADPATGRTGNPRVFVGGDAMSGGELVVTAVQDGKRAARAICETLGVAVRPGAPLAAGHR
uniref:Glutamate synthase n=1 Tax=Eiseniibacteriota bacterium TaxID=2212470 RepID=A0A832MLD5_UNCEI